MKINNLQINGYGKLSNKDIGLNKNINIIYGKNEAGKSTLLNFINSIFYGASKNKNGKDISDYDKYLPWKTEEFSGKISYELDNGEQYEIFRDFRKKTPIIYRNKQDISSEYSIDKSRGIDFLFEQTNIDEDTFKNTIIVPQNDIKIDQNAQNSMIQRISNIVSSGDENISYKRTMDKINKKQLEEVGTDRTKEKPINIVDDKIQELKNAKGKLEIYKSFLEENENEVQKIQDKIDNEETKIALYRVLKESHEESKIKNSEIEVIQKIRDEYFDKIEELDDKIDKDAKEKIKQEKQVSVLTMILAGVIILSAIAGFIVRCNYIIPVGLIAIAIAIITFDIVRSIKLRKNKSLRMKELEELENKIEQEINIMRNNIKTCQAQIDSKQEEIKNAENEVNRLVMNNFEEKLDSDFIEGAFELKTQDLDNKIADRNDKINSLKIEQGAKQNQKELMQEELNGISKIQEKLDSLEEERDGLVSLNNSYNLAKEGLENAYENIRNSLSPEFTNKLNQIISRISNEKYQDVNFTDLDGLIVQIEDGRFMPVERLSQGTIDQMYLSLRLASIDIMTNEKMPIILDETFAFFDDNRLKNILSFINQEYQDKQVIIFTCTRREIDILNSMNIEYNCIDLEN